MPPASLLTGIGVLGGGICALGVNIESVIFGRALQAAGALQMFGSAGLFSVMVTASALAG